MVYDSFILYLDQQMIILPSYNSSVGLSNHAKAHVLKYYNETPGRAFQRFVQTNLPALFSIGEDRAAIVKAVVSQAGKADCFDMFLTCLE